MKKLRKTSTSSKPQTSTIKEIWNHKAVWLLCVWAQFKKPNVSHHINQEPKLYQALSLQEHVCN